MPVAPGRADAPGRRGRHSRDRRRAVRRAAAARATPTATSCCYGEHSGRLLRRRRAARRDHAERGPLGGHGARPAGPLPRHAAPHRATWRRARLPGPRAVDRRSGRAGAGDRASTTRERLDVAPRRCAGGAQRPTTSAGAIWGGGLGFHEQRFALVEAISHLERLVELGPGRRGRNRSLVERLGRCPAPDSGHGVGPVARGIALSSGAVGEPIGRIGARLRLHRDQFRRPRDGRRAQRARL